MRWKTSDYHGWGRVLRARSRLARPERLSHLAEIAKESPAPAIGNCRSYGDACLNAAGDAIVMTRLDRILSFDARAGTVEAEAGIRIGELARILAPQGWLPAVMPGTGMATLGGCIANDVHGKNHHKLGSFGQHVTGLTLLNGEVKTTCSPRRNKALFAATMGGVGQTGVIVSAKLKLIPCPGAAMQVTERRAENWDMFLEMLDASQASYTVGWIDATARGAAMGRGILEEGELTSGHFAREKGEKSVPFQAPSFALSPPVVRAFNRWYYRRVPAAGRVVVRPIDEFFFPLDKIHDWNRLYGKHGFHQFQAVVPLDAAPDLREMMRRIAHSGLASPLAVLKRMGPGRAGPMSFPMEGYTLAVDFPNRAAARALISELEAMLVAAGGRFYLAKDSLAHGDLIKAMYPEHGGWCETVARADPQGRMETDMVRRLDLRRAL